LQRMVSLAQAAALDASATRAHASAQYLSGALAGDRARSRVGGAETEPGVPARASLEACAHSVRPSPAAGRGGTEPLARPTGQEGVTAIFRTRGGRVSGYRRR